MKKKICVVTGSRAEYHLLTPLMQRIMDREDYELQLVVTGTHLSEDFGYTISDIEADGFPICYKIPILGDGDKGTPSEVNQASAKALVGFDEYLVKYRPDMVVLLGDRYEILPIAIASMMHRIPIAHIHGGEKTEGAIDDAIRHAITKMATLHFTSCEDYRKRVIQLGENPCRVFNVGACGIENIKNVELIDGEMPLQDLGLPKSKPFIVATYHPTTLGEDATVEIKAVLAAFDYLRELGYSLVITKANADAGGLAINDALDRYQEGKADVSVSFSLGMQRYLSALNSCAAVVGNSSSGLLEAPSFGVPTVNIGDRQKGRVRSTSVIDCRCDIEEIKKAIDEALSSDFQKVAKKTLNPYGDGKVSSRIMSSLDDYFVDNQGRINAKEFYDIEFAEE